MKGSSPICGMGGVDERKVERLPETYLNQRGAMMLLLVQDANISRGCVGG